MMDALISDRGQMRATLAVVAFLAACPSSDPIAPPPPSPPNISLQITGSAIAGGTSASATVSANGAELIVVGTLLTPGYGFKLVPSMTVLANRIEVNIAASNAGDGGISGLFWKYDYAAKSVALPAGTYLVRVRHILYNSVDFETDLEVMIPGA